MEHHLTKIIRQLVVSQQQLARLLEAERHKIGKMADMVCDIPGHGPTLGGLEGIIKHSGDHTKNIAAYLNSLADLEDAIADMLEPAIKELREPEEQE
ncbi:nucleoside-diphosphate sugar epimerase [Paenibacillus aurantius]|uniref:Nucleoside-diphosphate sugar epimerase n=1 Tax=Paenibacillus aurantius TaxID=2918900 RepID=A0AA96LGN6_9BACL|nr:nucleoside-diphosphate sugar epimerase [Paenibacillus aurantius]WJH32482.1 nucleoside-diphosphate sugar epimerase [Paenibacillus sp. CC-CFT747]WNQ12889.1 nucleoside-diphosphate sugar epimerase [Paenibacillus aurantius]